MDDEQLLREFADSGSETAFRALVQRHLGMVLAVALRRTGSHNTAWEIAQAVFTVLAQKARRLDGRTNLTGWLYRATLFECAEVHRQDQARAQKMKAYEPDSNQDCGRSGAGRCHSARDAMERQPQFARGIGSRSANAD